MFLINKSPFSFSFWSEESVPNVALSLVIYKSLSSFFCLIERRIVHRKNECVCVKRNLHTFVVLELEVLWVLKREESSKIPGAIRQ